MNQQILKVISRIKENLKEVEMDGVTHSLFDDIYDNLGEIEDIIYDDEMQDGYTADEDDF